MEKFTSEWASRSTTSRVPHHQFIQLEISERRMLSDQYQRVQLNTIVVPRADRQRREIETKDLEASIRLRGVYNPIIVRRDGDALVLVAGERRLTACRNLGLVDIPVRFAEDLSQTEASIIELEENIKRSDLEWRDLVRAVAQIHRLYAQARDGWTMTETSEQIGLSLGAVSMYLKVHDSLADDRIAQAGTVREAYNILTRREQRAAGEALQELLEVPTPVQAGAAVEAAVGERKPDGNGVAYRGGADVPVPEPWPLLGHSTPPAPAHVPVLPESILQTSFLDWAPTYSGPKFNLIHCDFPYGIEVFNGPQGRGAEPTHGYDDSEATFHRLVECLCQNLDRIMSVSGHLMFWYSARPGSRREAEIRKRFGQMAPSLAFKSFPLIWHKTDNAGIASDPRHGPRHVYETCLVATRGNRQIVRVVSDVYGCPTDKRLHASTKPEPMLKHFMAMLVDETTSLLDPTCGSGAALRAAEALGAKSVLGLEIDPQFVGPARQALRSARALRAASHGGER